MHQIIKSEQAGGRVKKNKLTGLMVTKLCSSFEWFAEYGSIQSVVTQV